MGLTLGPPAPMVNGRPHAGNHLDDFDVSDRKGDAANA
jgi:hypothetical protein